jgi:hypothetical protein
LYPNRKRLPTTTSPMVIRHLCEIIDRRDSFTAVPPIVPMRAIKKDPHHLFSETGISTGKDRHIFIRYSNSR